MLSQDVKFTKKALDTRSTVRKGRIQYPLNRKRMLFLTNELAKKAEITVLSARESTRPGLQAGASWVERKPYIKGGVARDSHLGL